MGVALSRSGEPAVPWIARSLSGTRDLRRLSARASALAANLLCRRRLTLPFCIPLLATVVSSLSITSFVWSADTRFLTLRSSNQRTEVQKEQR